jgi:hypothetical protein
VTTIPPKGTQMLNDFRRAVRAKAVRVVDEVVSRYHREQSAQVAELHTQVAELHHALADLRARLNEDLRAQSDRVLETLGHVEHRARRDLSYMGEAEAALLSSRFVSSHMAGARSFPDPHSTLEYALSLAPEEGMALEFGVYSGITLQIIAAARDGEVYGFDSFEGLPESWRAGFPVGAFDDVRGLTDVPGADLVVGWFDEVLPGFLAEHPGPVALLHVDCDLYSSAKTVLDLVGPRLRPGSVVAFDEYFNYPGWPEHEHRAWQEYVAAHGLRFDYVGYTIDHEQVVVRITD